MDCDNNTKVVERAPRVALRYQVKPAKHQRDDKT